MKFTVFHKVQQYLMPTPERPAKAPSARLVFPVFYLCLHQPPPPRSCFFVVHPSHHHHPHHLHPNPFCSQEKMRSAALCPQINRPYSPLSQAAEATSALYSAVQYGGGGGERQKRGVCVGEGRWTQGCSPGCLMHYWGVHLSRQLQVEGWNRLISCSRQQSARKHSWPQQKSSFCEVDADAALWRPPLGFLFQDFGLWWKK